MMIGSDELLKFKTETERESMTSLLCELQPRLCSDREQHTKTKVFPKTENSKREREGDYSQPSTDGLGEHKSQISLQNT